MVTGSTDYGEHCGEGANGPARRGGKAGLPPGLRRALVLGASRSGIAAALALVDLDVEVTLSDRRDEQALAGIDAALSAGVRFIAEESLANDWPGPDLVVKSPGVPGETPAVLQARGRGVPVWSELELAYAVLPNPFDAITGTNGKTTTTALLGHLFKTAGRPARVLGNIGVAVTSVAGELASDEEVVVEVSSFQLEDTHAFRPAVGVFLNLTPDHLDRHGTMERYLACKANLFANQTAEDVAVLNLADPQVTGLGAQLVAREGGPRVVFFSTIWPNAGKQGVLALSESGGHPRMDGSQVPYSWIENGLVVVEGEPLLPVHDIPLPGLHNLENCLAAATAAAARGVVRDALAEGLRSFRGVPHRLEQAGMVAGVTYVNDSKATNVEATLTALNAYPERTHLILGGRDKASDYRPVARACARGCKAVYLIGEATPLIADAFAEVAAGGDVDRLPEVSSRGDLEQAVKAAAGAAIPGDVVLLAPACASFDQYRDFEERGDHFKSLVQRLQREKP
jgi:UDP-N-acetylmuramoylalanine--D-glutamate ligase